MPNDKKVLVITGTRKGIGRYLAEYYLAKDLIVCGCSRSANDIEHPQYYHYELDVTDEKAVKHMISDVQKRNGKIDYLVNNAGIAVMNHSLLTPTSVLEKIFSTNVFGSFSFMRESAKAMASKKFGRIVNFTTVAVPFRLEGESVYAASKAAVELLTKVLAKELLACGITCNAIGPSPIKTDLIRNIGEEKLKKLLERQAISDYASMDDVSNVIDFYISDRSSMITGQVLYLGGVVN